MSTVYNFDAIPAAEQALESIREVVKKMESLAQTTIDTAKTTGAGQLIKDATVGSENLMSLVELIKSAVGESGDNISTDGTFTGMVEGAKQMDISVNGK